MKQKPLLTIRETAEVLGISYRKIRRLVYKGTIPATRVGRDWYISASWVGEKLNGTPAERSAS